MMTIYGRKITEADMDIIANYMDDETREEIHRELAPCTPEEFIAAYLDEDPDFIKTLEQEFDFDDVPEPRYYIVINKAGYTIFQSEDKADCINFVYEHQNDAGYEEEDPEFAWALLDPDGNDVDC